MITALIFLVVVTIVPAVFLAAFGSRLFKTSTMAPPVSHARRAVVKFEKSALREKTPV